MNDQAKTIVVAGCGYVGTQTAQILHNLGHHVWGLKRDTSTLPEGIQPLSIDLTRPAELAKLPKQISAIIYTATAPERTDEAYVQTYVHGIDNIHRELHQRGQHIDRFIFTSSTAVYHQKHGETVNENSATTPTRFTGKRMLEAEASVRKFQETKTATHAINLRLSGIYGPGRTRLIERVFKQQAQMPSTAKYTNRIHREDCAGIITHLLTLNEPKELYLGVDNDPADQREVLPWLADKLTVPHPSKITQDKNDTANKRCSNQRIKESGYTFRVPTFREGYPAIIKAFLSTYAR